MPHCRGPAALPQLKLRAVLLPALNDRRLRQVESMKSFVDWVSMFSAISVWMPKNAADADRTGLQLGSFRNSFG